MALCGGCLVTDFLLIVVGVLTVFYLLLQRVQNKWSQKGIPVVKANPLLGNMTDTILGKKSVNDIVRDMYLEHKNKPFVTFFAFMRPLVMINDMELVKTVLIKDFNVFSDRSFSVSPDDPMEYHGIFALRGQKWKNLRVKLTPTFTSGKLKKMFELINSCGNDFVTYINKESEKNGSVELKEAASKYTTDSIATVGFGIEGNALKNPDSEFRRILRLSTTINFWEGIKNTIAFVSPTLVEKFNIVITKPEVTEFCRRVVWEAVEYREKKKIKRNDFLDLLLELKNKGKVEGDEQLEQDEHIEQINEKIDLEGDKFVAQCFVFLVAGFETSAGTITHCLYELATNHDIQQKVYEEITSVIEKHRGKLTYEAVQDMTYLHMVIQETLRRYPVLPFLDRRLSQAYRLPGTNITLEEGDAIMIPVAGLHYDPELYPDPYRFDPERFSEENKKTRPPCSFLGFGDGPRICIGMRLAWLQVKIGLIHILRNFNVVPTAETPTKITFQNTTPFNFAQSGLFLRFEKRDTK